MEVRGLTLDQLTSAATDAGVELQNVRPKRQDGTSHLLTLRLTGELWRRLSPNTGRKIAAVCYHGYTAFMQRVFDTNPDATIISVKQRFDGQRDFQMNACGVGEQNAGSYASPVSYSEACACEGSLAEARV